MPNRLQLLQLGNRKCRKVTGMSLPHVESLLALLQPRDKVIHVGFVGRVARRSVHSRGGTQVVPAHVPLDEAGIPAGIPLRVQRQLGIVEERRQKPVGIEIAQVDRPVQLLAVLEWAGLDQTDAIRSEGRRLPRFGATALLCRRQNGGENEQDKQRQRSLNLDARWHLGCVWWLLEFDYTNYTNQDILCTLFIRGCKMRAHDMDGASNPPHPRTAAGSCRLVSPPWGTCLWALCRRWRRL